MSSVDGFIRVAGCEVAGVTTQKFKSSRTGLVVCLAQVEGPIVEGFFCLGERTSLYLPHKLCLGHKFIIGFHFSY